MSQATWTEALLWPDGASRSPRNDRYLTARLVLGDIHAVGITVDDRGGSRGAWSLAEGEVAEQFPVASSLARWSARFGRGLHTAEPFPGAQLIERGEDGLVASTLLAALALGTDERHDDAIEVIGAALEHVPGPLGDVLRVQLAHRLLDAGRTEEARQVCEVVGQSRRPGRTARGAVTVALHNRLAATPWEAVTPAMRRAAFRRAQVPDTTARTLRGLDGVVADTLDTHVVAASGPCHRWRNQDERLWALLGAWLKAELWGNHRVARAARRSVALYALIGTAVAYPDGWTRTVADAADLDLLRRADAVQDIGRVARWWWIAGPVEDLRQAVDVITRRTWAPPAIESNLAVLAGAGDLVDPDRADVLVERIMTMVEEEAGAPRLDTLTRATRALETVLAVSTGSAQEKAMDAWTRWVVRSPHPFVLLRYQMPGGC